MLDDSLFDDLDRLHEADTRGVLRSAAFAGAQVRSVTETAAEVDLGYLAGDRPRALILLARPGIAPAACRMLAALLGPSCPVPVVVRDVVPAWVGPLDVVFAHCDDAGDSVLAESLAVASRRGAHVVLSAPSDGPVAAAVAGRAALLPPKIPVPAALSLAHVVGAGLTVVTALGLLSADTEQLADELDQEAARSHPRHDMSTNPAKALALRLADRLPLLWGIDELCTSVASHGAFALGCHAAMACDVESFQQAVTRKALHQAATSADSEADLFADPEEITSARQRVFLLSTRHAALPGTPEHAAVAALPGADVVAPPEAVPEDAVVRSMLLAARFDLAAVYLGLGSGTVNGPGWPVMAMH